METYQGQTRLYVIIGTMLGLMVGVFAQSFLSDDAGAFRLVGLLVFAAIGGLAGKLLVVAQSPAVEPRAVDGQGAPDSDDPGPTEATRFFKLQSGVFSDGDLKRLRVRPASMPMSPPEAEIPLQVSDYDHYARVPVIDGVLERMTVEEVAERVLSEAMTKAPKVPTDLELRLVSFHSEGPLGPDGRCPLGWSFFFVDGALGLGCWATATQRDIALHFHTVATWSRPASWNWIDMDDLLKWIETTMPDWADEDVYVRVILPDDYLAFVRNPIRIVDIDVDEGSVLNEAFLHGVEGGPHTEAWSLRELLTWFRTGEVDEESDLAAATADEAFAEGLRTMEQASLRRAAAALERRSGGRVVDSILRSLADADDPVVRSELVHLLAYVPSGLAPVALHRLAVEPADEATAKAAGELHRLWRNGDLDVPRHPLEGLNFLDERNRMGRGTLAVVPLQATYDPETDLLPVLAEFGLEERRRRMLSGNANLLVGAQLRSDDSETEALLTSTPLPVPCHVLHVVGPKAEQIAGRVRRSPINYPRATIVADVHSDRPSRVHRAALYVAALHIDEAHLTPHLIRAAERAGRNEPLRRAVATALAVQSDAEAQAYLAAAAAEDDGPVEQRDPSSSSEDDLGAEAAAVPTEV